MRGFAIPLSVHRRMVIDFLHFAKGLPTVPVQKRMSLVALVDGVKQVSDRYPTWSVPRR